jgi:O-acetyl-ADP-ribose deacetylase
VLPVTINNTQLILVKGSVADQEVDAIVNAANTMMRGGGGIDGVIHRRAGKAMVVELEGLVPNRTKTSQVVVTHGHNLPQPFVFHVAGPRWRDGKHQEPEQLAACYGNCLAEADKLGLTSIAYCSISTGVYGFPIELAAPLAVQTVVGYLREHLETKIYRVVLAMYGDVEHTQFEKALETADLAAL